MISLINSMAQQWFTWQLDMLWQTAVLIGIIWVIDLLIRKWAWPQVRYALWMLVLVKLLIPPTWTSPVSVTSCIPDTARKAVSIQFNSTSNDGETVPVAEQFGPALSESAQRTNPLFNNVPAQPAENLLPADLSIESAAAEHPTINLPEESIPPAMSLSWKVYAMFTWLAGVAVLSIWLMMRLRTLRNEQFRIDPRFYFTDRFCDQIENAAAKLKLNRRPAVVLTDKVSSPAVFGVFRPVLLMPARKLKKLSDRDIEHILLHELAHIKRGDLTVHAVYMVLQIAYWFNPLLWLIRRTLQNLRELCCDATVARLLKDNTVYYRQTLLETARQLVAEPVDPGLGLLGLFENSNWLLARLKWLEKKTWKNRPLRIAVIVLLIAVMATCVLPMANRVEIDSNDFVKEINGCRIELVAVNHLSAETGWWRPDGSPCDVDIETEDHNTYPAENPGYKLVFRIEGGRNLRPRLAVKGSNPQSGLDVISPEGLTGWRCHIKPDLKKTRVKVGILGDAWETIASHSGRGTDGRVIDGKKVVFSPVQQTTDGLSVTVSDDFEYGPGMRIVAVDNNGTVHAGRMTADLTLNGLHQQTWQFDNMEQDSIKEFQFQTQEYTWVTFKDVALRSQEEVMLKITGTVTDAQTGRPIADVKVFDDGYADDPDWNKIKPDKLFKWGAITNAAGEYSFLTYYEEHFIKCEGVGYTAERKILLTKLFGSEKEKSINFELTKNAEHETQHDESEQGMAITAINQLLEQWFADCRADNSVQAFGLWYPADSDGDAYKEIRQVLDMEPDWTFDGITEALFFEDDGMQKAVVLSGGCESADDAFGEKSAIQWDMIQLNDQQWKISKFNFIKLALRDTLRTFILEEHPQAQVWKTGVKTDVETETQYTAPQSQNSSEVEKAPGQSSNDEMRGLLEEKRQILQNNLDQIEMQYEAGQVGPGEVGQAKIHLLQVESQLAQTPPQRIEILQEIVNLYKEQEQTIQLQLDYGRGGPTEMNAAILRRLEAEKALLEAKQGNSQQTSEQPGDPLTRKVKTVTFQKNLRLADALHILSEMYKVNIIPSAQTANQRMLITVTNLYDVTFEDILKALCGNTHKYIIKDNFIYVYTNEEYDALHPDVKTDVRSAANESVLSLEMESFANLRRFMLACLIYAQEHDMVLPPDVNALKPYLDNEVYEWAHTNLVYLNRGKLSALRNVAYEVLAYDRHLLETVVEKGRPRTNVGFADGHVEMKVTPEQLENEFGVAPNLSVGPIDIAPAGFELRFDEKRLTFDLVVSIQNQNDAVIPKFKIRYYRGDPNDNLDETGHPHSGWHEAGPIEPGNTWNESTRDFYLPDGDYTFTVILDYDNTVPETNEANNQATLDVTIKEGRIVETSEGN